MSTAFHPPTSSAVYLQTNHRTRTTHRIQRLKMGINGRVFIAAGFPGTRYKLKAAGFNCTELEMSEFEKKDGGLSCLSLRFWSVPNPRDTAVQISSSA